MGRKMLGTGPFSKLVLSSTQLSSEGYISVDTKQRDLIGQTGVAASTLRPNGRVIIEGEHYDANAASGYIEKGEEVKVVRYETNQLYVRKTKK
jgi:membrane-bound serine protease (ClpP class)